MASEEVRTKPTDDESLLEICRLCMSTESLEDVFELEDVLKSISDYLSIRVSPVDSISHAICTICRIQLDEFHQFRMRCQEVQATLWSLVRTEETVATSEGSKRGTRQRKKPASSYSKEPLERAIEEDESLTGNHMEAANTECLLDRIEIGLVKIEALSDDNTEEMEEMFEESNDAIISNETNFRRKDTGNVEAQVGVQQNDKTVQKKLQRRCDECSRVYPTNQKLKIHKRKVHGERKHACHICGKGYILPSQLRLHVKRHEEATRIKCNMCDQRFKHTKSLWQHETNHHSFCPDCGIQFETRRHLDSHRRSILHRINVEMNGDSKNEKNKEVIDESCSNDATDGTYNRTNEIEKAEEAPSRTDETAQQQQHQCDKCQKKFMTKKQMQDHIRQVHGEKKLVCPVCDKGFLAPSQLRTHLRSHDKARACTCDVCGKCFKEERTLFLHKRTKHHSLEFVQMLREAKLDSVRSAPPPE